MGVRKLRSLDGRGRLTLAGRGASIWALVGVSALFASAVFRLGVRGLTTIGAELLPAEWVALLLLTAVFVYAEGMRAIERRWVPHFIERAREVRNVRSPLVRLLAPIHGLSLIAAPRAELARAWAGVTAIAAVVWLVQTFPDPWRGIIDFAVAAALLWGLAAILRRAPEVFAK